MGGMSKPVQAALNPFLPQASAAGQAVVNAVIPKIPDFPTAMPTPSAPTQAPAVGDSSQLAAQRKTLASLQRRQGRAASILTQGGLDNASSRLGS